MSKTLLLADDSVVIQKLVGLSFANEDITIVTTDNGDDAVAKAREIVPDIVLADVVMPGMSGYEVCEAIKRDPALAHVPVLLLTGTFEAFDEGRAREAGADGQITKPFEAQALVERVTEVINSAAVAAASTALSAAPADDSLTNRATIGTAIGSIHRAASSHATAGVTNDETDSMDGSNPNLPPSAKDFDFFDSQISTLSADDSSAAMDLGDASPETAGPSSMDDDFFGAPGEGANEVLDTQGGGLALGDFVSNDFAANDALVSHDRRAGDATVVALPEPVASLPPSQGDPLTGFEEDIGFSALPQETDPSSPPPIPAAQSFPLTSAVGAAGATQVGFSSALDAVPSDPGATIVAEIDDRNASTSPNMSMQADSLAEPEIIDDGFDDFTVHSPQAAIDSDFAAGRSPERAAKQDHSSDADAASVANLDISLAEPYLEPSAEFTPSAPIALDLGPTNVSADELDFAFDVSEQAPVAAADDPYGESFSSLMDISESQILGEPASDNSPALDALNPERAPGSAPNFFAAGYDVSSSDLATAKPAEPVFVADDDQESIEIGGLDGSGESDPAIDHSIGLELGAPRPIDTNTTNSHESNSISSTSSRDIRISDLSPMVEQRIQETLEKVAWEAFSDLSESIVKQVIDRVEKIAWEVIPQMAETLVREEIRKMKGEDD